MLRNTYCHVRYPDRQTSKLSDSFPGQQTALTADLLPGSKLKQTTQGPSEYTFFLNASPQVQSAMSLEKRGFV